VKTGIVVFPGTWSDRDVAWVIQDVLGHPVEYLWHKDTNLKGCDFVVLPGGFSFGDYLRPGAIARLSPIIESIVEFADKGGIVLGICNGFQILLECGLLPGALLPNASLEYRCQDVFLLVEQDRTAFTCQCKRGQVLRIPISHGEGNYYADPDTINQLERSKRIVFRYCTSEGEVKPEANPNGSLSNIAGIINEAGNVLGMMPHPERCGEEILGSTDGLYIFRSVLETLKANGK
jgi:phosphoribosylformylglycinamidine synthase I